MSASSSTGCGIIEYDNTQDWANHIHSVWRDLRRDFAGDLLASTTRPCATDRWLSATSRAPGRREPLRYEISNEIPVQEALALLARSGGIVVRRHARRMPGGHCTSSIL
jgi:hypothetical protein